MLWAMATSNTATDSAVPLEAGAVEALASSFRGALIRPGDRTYDEHRRVWNGSIDRYPALIARCAGVEDVIAAVRFARIHGLLVAVRGGGHSYPGYSVCDGGMVIDLSLMKRIHVDPETRTGRVQAGVLLGELDRETQAFGFAVPAGFVSHTGVAGLTLGGGIGFTMRKFGLTIDNLLSVDLITAQGEFLKASEHENADLFWGVRGGGGNFGIVTEFEFRLNPLGPQVFAGPIFWPMDEAPSVLSFYRDWIADCPDELMTLIVERRAPALPAMPPDLVGQRVVAVVCVYAGSVDEGELNDDIIDVMVDYGHRIESSITSLALWQMGGAVSRVGEGETAFNGRRAGHTFNINGNTMTAEGFAQEREWARGLWTALEPYHTSVYVNFLMEEGEDRVRQAYGAAKYDRLRMLKRKYDPDNFFRLNQNIPPAEIS